MRWLIAFNQFVVLYYLYSAVHYLLLMVASLWSSVQHQRRIRNISLQEIYSSPFTPPISLLVPAYNEEVSIVETVRSLLSLTCPDFEVVVINDGSEDQTLARLEGAFQLIRTQYVIAPRLKTQTVRAAYVSLTEPRLLVLDKENGGGKADALNAGINVARNPYFCALDADAVLESDALLRMALPMVLDPERVVAVGGIVRVVNGCRVASGRVTDVHLPRPSIEAIQVVEYLRAFLFGREGWSALNGMLIISGAFGCFSRQMVLELGGYRADAIAEDMDLVVRMHLHLRRQRGSSYRIRFIPDQVCWTEVPGDLASLAGQRKRWQKGLVQVLWRYRIHDAEPALRVHRAGGIPLPRCGGTAGSGGGTARLACHPNCGLAGSAHLGHLCLFHDPGLSGGHVGLHWFGRPRGDHLPSLPEDQRGGAAASAVHAGVLSLPAVSGVLAGSSNDRTAGGQARLGPDAPARLYPSASARECLALGRERLVLG